MKLTNKHTEWVINKARSKIFYRLYDDLQISDIQRQITGLASQTEIKRDMKTFRAQVTSFSGLSGISGLHDATGGKVQYMIVRVINNLCTTVQNYGLYGLLAFVRKPRAVKTDQAENSNITFSKVNSFVPLGLVLLKLQWTFLAATPPRDIAHALPQTLLDILDFTAAVASAKKSTELITIEELA